MSNCDSSAQHNSLGIFDQKRSNRFEITRDFADERLSRCPYAHDRQCSTTPNRKPKKWPGSGCAALAARSRPNTCQRRSDGGTRQVRDQLELKEPHGTVDCCSDT